jgi:hypothetical protein
MHAYIFSENEGAAGKMLPDLKAVKDACRGIPKDYRDNIRVTLEDFPCDKAAFIAAYNGQPKPAQRVLKKWRIGGPRGGKLIEIQVEED